MKNFRFRYENILKLKEDAEDKVKHELAMINSKLVQLKNELDYFRHEEVSYLHSVDKLLSNGCSAFDLRNIENYKNFHRKRIKSQEMEVERTEELLALKKGELVEAIKEKKIMEKLKEREYNSYLENVKAAEEKVVDQIVSYKSTKSSGE